MQWVKQMLGQVQSKDDFLKGFTSIRGDIGKAKTGADLLVVGGPTHMWG